MTDLVMAHEAFARSRAAIARAADELASQRAAIDVRVTGFLGAGWSGAASDDFHEAWDDWRAGASDVDEGLAAMAELLGAAQQALRVGDESARSDLEQVSARLVERLGR